MYVPDCSYVVKFQLPAAIRDRSNVLYLGAHVTTYDGAEHDQRIPVNMNMKVKENCNLKTNDLACFEKIADNEDNYIFDQKTRGIFSKITVSFYDEQIKVQIGISLFIRQ